MSLSWISKVLPSYTVIARRYKGNVHLSNLTVHPLYGTFIGPKLSYVHGLSFQSYSGKAIAVGFSVSVPKIISLTSCTLDQDLIISASPLVMCKTYKPLEGSVFSKSTSKRFFRRISCDRP